MNRQRDIAVVTTSRADFGIYLPLLRRIEASPALRLRLVAGGSHLSYEHGRTEHEIEAEGFAIHRRIECVRPTMAAGIAAAIEGMTAALSDWRPDVALVLGDRYEMLGCAVALAASRIPVAHIHGGEVTEGALDDSFRHAITKLSHIHFAVSEDAASRIEQLGEEPWRIHRTGSPTIDRLLSLKPEEIELPERFLLVTYHPVTLEEGAEGEQAEALVAALEAVGLPCVVTAPNADPGRERIEKALHAFCDRSSESRFVVSAGARLYATHLRRAAAMVGNSSSGLVEAPSFALPVVNVGSRQDGRTRSANVIDCGYGVDQIVTAIRQALDPAFRASLNGLASPYGDGHASERITKALETVELGPALLRKRFCDLSASNG
jgi:UDP-hydrolysing UDP-N-acetyl-D-glucosamine 2-epimerase